MITCDFVEVTIVLLTSLASSSPFSLALFSWCRLKIAEGLDRHRADSSLLIWDIHSKHGPDHSLSHDRRGTSSQHPDVPFVEIGEATITALCN